MYDKVKIWVDRCIVGDELSNIPNYLTTANCNIDVQTGEQTGGIYGHLNNLKVSLFESGISIIGSLPKYVYGNNLHQMTRQATENAIKQIGEELHLCLDEALVTGIEFGANYIMEHPVSDYINQMQTMPRMMRCPTNTTLYYRGKGKTHPKQYVFYDKKKEMVADGYVLPDEINAANILRYEMRFDGRLAKQLKEPQVLVSTLYDEQFYNKMLSKYRDAYYSIKRSKQINQKDMKNIKNPKEACRLIIGGVLTQDYIDASLSQLKEANVFGSDRKMYSRTKQMLERNISNSADSSCNVLLDELDNKIDEACQQG